MFSQFKTVTNQDESASLQVVSVPKMLFLQIFDSCLAALLDFTFCESLKDDIFHPLTQKRSIPFLIAQCLHLDMEMAGKGNGIGDDLDGELPRKGVGKFRTSKKSAVLSSDL